MVSHGQVVYLDTVESNHRLRSTVQIALRDKVHSTALGKAFLAALPAEEARKSLEGMDRVPMTPNTMVDIGPLVRELEIVKVRGYAIDDEENEIGSRCVAAAIHGSSHRPIAAISVSAPSLTDGRQDPGQGRPTGLRGGQGTGHPADLNTRRSQRRPAGSRSA